jgi:hypothetical protein
LFSENRIRAFIAFDPRSQSTSASWPLDQHSGK